MPPEQISRLATTNLILDLRHEWYVWLRISPALPTGLRIKFGVVMRSYQPRSICSTVNGAEDFAGRPLISPQEHGAAQRMFKMEPAMAVSSSGDGINLNVHGLSHREAVRAYVCLPSSSLIRRNTSSRIGAESLRSWWRPPSITTERWPGKTLRRHSRLKSLQTTVSVSA